MILGLDLYDTLTRHPAKYRALAYAVLADGGEVHIISAVKKGNGRKAEADAKKYSLEATIHVVEYDNFYQAPALKYEVCRDVGVDMFFDDQKLTVSYLNQKKILAFVSP